MPAKRKITIKKKVEEVAEKPVETVEENVIENAIEEEMKEIKAEANNASGSVIGTVGKSIVAKPVGRISFEAQVAPVPMFKLPEDIRRYLINNGFTSEIYKKDKEWLEKHNVDMKMVEKLKQFLVNMDK